MVERLRVPDSPPDPPMVKRVRSDVRASPWVKSPVAE